MSCWLLLPLALHNGITRQSPGRAVLGEGRRKTMFSEGCCVYHEAWLGFSFAGELQKGQEIVGSRGKER